MEVAAADSGPVWWPDHLRLVQLSLGEGPDLSAGRPRSTVWRGRLCDPPFFMPRMPHSTDDLAAAEDELRRAQLAADVVAMEALLDDEAELFDEAGVASSKPEEIEAFRSGRLRLREYAVERQRVRVLGELGTTDVVAEVAGTREGAPFQARLRFQRTWRLTSDWSVVATHVSQVKRGG